MLGFSPSLCGNRANLPLQSSPSGHASPVRPWRLSVPVLPDILDAAQKNKRRKNRLPFSLPEHKSLGWVYPNYTPQRFNE